MVTFVDPRTGPSPSTAKPLTRTANDPALLEDLLTLCREGRLYEVERWIESGKPLQYSAEVVTMSRRRTSPLRVAIERQNYALVHLLLCNGYNANMERECPLDLVLETRQSRVVELLLVWGADPHRVDLEKLFETYSSSLFQRFYDLGVGLTVRHAMAAALGFHTSNKPLFGFAKRHREHDASIQNELDMALAHHAAEGNEKGALLCLWAGADPHARVPSLRYWDDEEDDDEEDYEGWSAVCGASFRGHTSLLQKFGPDPSLDDFQYLFELTTSPEVVDILAPLALPRDMTPIVRHLVSSAHYWFRYGNAVSALERLFEHGARWTKASNEDIKTIRRELLQMDDDDFAQVIEAIAADNHCTPPIRYEVARTGAIRKRLKRLGYLTSRRDDPDHHFGRRPEGADEIVAQLGLEVKQPNQPKKRLPRSVSIFARLPEGAKIRTDREGLLDLVWSKPISQLADEWGITGTGLAKACRNVKVPVPPRGFWAKTAAGQRMKRPKLQKLPDGQAEEIVIG